MKTLRDLRTEQEELNELTAMQDPPTVLTLRRKAIRLFPGHQKVATYRNDNLDIEIAIPYNDEKFGKHFENIPTVESVDEAMSPELKRLRKDRAMFKREKSRAEDHLATSRQRLDWAKRALAGHIKKHGKTLDPIGECFNQIVESTGELNEMSAEGLFGEYLHKPGHDLVLHVQSKWGHKAAHHFMKAAEHYGQDYKKATHHFDAFKRHTMGEEVITEISKETLSSYVRGAASHLTDLSSQMNSTKNAKKHRELEKKYYTRGVGVNKAIDKIHAKEEVIVEDMIMEASIHAIHAIMKTQHPAQVRFRDGSTAMVDHPTAHQIMHLHSKVNRQNKKKIEALINSGAGGIRKVSDFIRDHMKIGKK